MFWKVVILFLCAMVLVGMVGKLIFPQKERPKAPRRFGIARCEGCGKPRIGQGRCGCGRDGR